MAKIEDLVKRISDEKLREEIRGSIPIINEATREIDLDGENGM